MKHRNNVVTSLTWIAKEFAESFSQSDGFVGGPVLKTEKHTDLKIICCGNQAGYLTITYFYEFNL